MAAELHYEKCDQLENAIWSCIPCLGKNWLGKWISSADGFEIIITDGIFVWEEYQDAFYIAEKAKEWAICIEGDIESLSKEILNQLNQECSSLSCKEKSSSLLIIELSASLEGLPYQWIFTLKLASPSRTNHHWIFPIAASLKCMEMRVQKLETELKRRERQLRDLDPKYLYSCDSSNTNSLMSTCTETVLSTGLGKIFCENNFFSPELLNTFYKSSRSFKSNSFYQDSNMNQKDKIEIVMQNETVEPVSNKKICTEQEQCNPHETTTKASIKKKQKRKICI